MKMSLLKLCFTPALLLLGLSCSLWQISQALPMKTTARVTDSCVLHAHTLLQNISGALTQNKLFSGIDCSKQSVELNSETNTTFDCTPTGLTCSGDTKSTFDQDSCLDSIVKDLHFYYQFLTSHPDPDSLLGPTVLLSIRELVKKCFTWSTADFALTQAVEDHSTTFDQRLRLCKVLRGFQIRTITINRAIGYMHAEENQKPVLQ
ncbi:interleukin-12 subunit alpha [Cynoglossus semilaevis]|uniref:Interleukin-12 subunit alpha n=1 Tax=Cynoglossus semilaevis TaxID=244447 RepID=A0A3P8WFG6_CYNSE|nr:interleukin-12 subunit alpha-like [Cynoglossus semilaevis]